MTTNRRNGRLQWLALLVVAAAIGAAAGLLAVGFRYALLLADEGRDRLVEFSRAFGGSDFLLPAVIASSMAAMAVWIVQRFAPEAAGSGIPHLKAVLERGAPFRPWRILPVKFLSGFLAIGAGLALGREGPTAQMGGSIAVLTGRLFAASASMAPTFASVGAAAGLAAAFNAPIAATIFVVEELRRTDARTTVLTLVACVVADILTRFAFGPEYIYPTSTPADRWLSLLPWACFLGIAGGVLGAVFNQSILFVVAGLASKARRFPALLGALVGLLAGFLSVHLPALTGDGDTLVRAARDGQIGLALAVAFLAIRFALTTLSFGCGAAGGIFAPLLAIGALLGCVFVHAARIGMPSAQLPIQSAVVLAMAAVLVASLHSPMTGILLLLELTGDFTLALPLLIASVVALTVSKLLGARPIYEALLEQKIIQRFRDAPA